MRPHASSRRKVRSGFSSIFALSRYILDAKTERQEERDDAHAESGDEAKFVSFKRI